jgi:hypothetical protein
MSAHAHPSHHIGSNRRNVGSNLRWKSCHCCVDERCGLASRLADSAQMIHSIVIGSMCVWNGPVGLRVCNNCCRQNAAGCGRRQQVASADRVHVDIRSIRIVVIGSALREFKAIRS